MCCPPLPYRVSPTGSGIRLGEEFNSLTTKILDLGISTSFRGTIEADISKIESEKYSGLITSKQVGIKSGIKDLLYRVCEIYLQWYTPSIGFSGMSINKNECTLKMQIASDNSINLFFNGTKVKTLNWSDDFNNKTWHWGFWILNTYSGASASLTHLTFTGTDGALVADFVPLANNAGLFDKVSWRSIKV